MIRRWVVFGVYLGVAAVLELAILPEFREAMPGGVGFVFGLRLLALAGVLAGLLRGEVAGMGVGLAGAVLLGAGIGPAYLGTSIVSFVLVGWLAGMAARGMARVLGRPGWVVLPVLVFGLLLVERLTWIVLVRAMWPNMPFELGVGGVLLTAVLGTGLFMMTRGRLEREWDEEE